MKKLVYSIVSIISLLCLASCAQDEKLILDPDNFVASSWKQTFDDVFVLDKNAAETPGDRKSTRLNSSHTDSSRMPSSA